MSSDCRGASLQGSHRLHDAGPVSPKQWLALVQISSVSLITLDWSDALEPHWFTLVVNQLSQSNIKAESWWTSVDWSKMTQEMWLLERVLTSPMSRELLLIYATINKSTAKLWVITHFSSAASIFRADLLALLLGKFAEIFFFYFLAG